MFLNVTVLLQSLLLTSCPLMSHIPFLNLMAPAPRSPLFSSLLLLPGEKPRKQGGDWLCKALLTTMPAFLLRSRAARDRDPAPPQASGAARRGQELGQQKGGRMCLERVGVLRNKTPKPSIWGRAPRNCAPRGQKAPRCPLWG